VSSSKKSSPESTPAITESAAAEEALSKANAKSGGKGRPTPTRAEAEAARKRPLVPEDRRAAAKAQRAKERVSRDAEYAAMKSGDEANMPYRDRGPVKRYIRDFVDARWNVGEYFLFAAGVFLVMTLLSSISPWISLVGLLLMYLVVLMVSSCGASSRSDS
jgi:Flp pilus assembly protein TadB